MTQAPAGTRRVPATRGGVLRTHADRNFPQVYAAAGTDGNPASASASSASS